MSTSPAATAAGAIALAGVGAALWGTAVEPRLFALRRFTVPVLPAGSGPLRVLHISDIHLVPRQRRKIAWLRSLARLQPDLVIDTGDNLSHQQAVPPLRQAVGPLLGLPGVFVMGSNDYFAPKPKNPFRYFTSDYARAPRHRGDLPTGELAAMLSSQGWVPLDNARTRLEVAGLGLEVVGVDDPHIGRDDYARVAGPADPDADLTIGVAHAPYQRVLDAMSADGARLIVAGHTHGGQVCVPGYGALVTNCDIDRRRAKGLSRWWPGAGDRPDDQAPADAAWLEVSAGLGASRYAPVRFACRPEATLLTLVASEGIRRG